MRRTITTLSLAFAAVLALAAPAFAGDNGEGLVGETNDKIITFFSLGVLVFFVIVVCIGSAIQAALDRRKNAKKAARLRGRTGW
jgi:nitrogen fixation/metabolism regulation signal transduction histidine kinase